MNHLANGGYPPGYYVVNNDAQSGSIVEAGPFIDFDDAHDIWATSTSEQNIEVVKHPAATVSKRLAKKKGGRRK